MNDYDDDEQLIGDASDGCGEGPAGETEDDAPVGGLVTHPLFHYQATPQGLPALLDDLAKWEDQVRRYDVLGACNPLANTLQQAHEALAAQAATLESIHKIIECAGPEAADEIADLLGYPSVEWPSDQAASVEPVGEVQWAAGVEGSFREVVFFDQPSPPAGTKLYAGAPPAHIPADAPVWNSIQIASWIGSQLMHEPAMFERSTVCKFVRSLGRHPTLLKHSPQPQAVDAVDEQREALRMGVECLRNWKILHPEDFDELDERAVALLKAALATKEPK